MYAPETETRYMHRYANINHTVTSHDRAAVENGEGNVGLYWAKWWNEC